MSISALGLSNNKESIYSLTTEESKALSEAREAGSEVHIVVSMRSGEGRVVM